MTPSAVSLPLSRRFAIAAPAAAKPPRLTKLVRYTTLMELRTALQALDDSQQATVVLALDERFCGHLTTLVERPGRRTGHGGAMRLILAVGSGRLPGLITIGDLAASGSALGWQEIVLECDAAAATAGARATLRPAERLTVFMPAWHEIDDVERELRLVD